MKLDESFDALRKHDHSARFDELGPWLDQQSKKPKLMKNLSKIAASFVIGTLMLLACTVPVEHEEEIGYMIKGISVETISSGKDKVSRLSEVNLSEIQFTPVLHEILVEDGKALPPEEVTEVVLLLPEANYQAAEAKMNALEAVLSFKSIEIMPIEETVERTFFESALHKTFDMKLNPDLSEEEIEIRINTFLHENSEVAETIDVNVDESGNRHVVFRVNIEDGGTFEVKRDIEQLYQDLTPENNQFFHENMTEQELIELKEREVQKKELKEQDL